jgi:hypothetical protein
MAQNTSQKGFKPSTVVNVINPLHRILNSKVGYTYPTLGHFYREIELLKFPWMASIEKGRRFNPLHGRNVYSQQQYESIVKYCEHNGYISIQPNISRKGSYVVHVYGTTPNTNINTSTKRGTRPAITGVIPAISQSAKIERAVNSTGMAGIPLDPQYTWELITIGGQTYLIAKK